MKPPLFLSSAAISLLLIPIVATAAMAQQQVTLRSGAVLIGKVRTQGQQLVIDIGGAELLLPMGEVAKIAAASGEAAQDAALPSRAQLLLLKGLEAQLLYDGEEKEIGLLAEAYRLAPNDPQIAYWYARSLANAGYGQGAQQVFEPRRAAIAAAFPGMAERLAEQIEERLKTELLPRALVKRLDQLAAASRTTVPIDPRSTSYAAYFRLLDQDDKPIDKSEFRIQCNGESEHVDSFADGFYLFTFVRRSTSSYNDDPCRLEVSQVGLETKTFEFRATADEAANAGEFRVKRLSEADRVPVVVRAVDQQGQPLVGVSVTWNSTGGFGRPLSVPAVVTDAEGIAKFELFPNRYTGHFVLGGYASQNELVTVVSRSEQPLKVEVKLYRAMAASIKVVWRSRAMPHPGMPTEMQESTYTSGEFEQHIGQQDTVGYRSGPYGPPWVRLMQNANQVELQFIEQMYYPMAASESWVGRLKEAAEAAQDQSAAEAAARRFENIKLSELDKLKEKVTLARAGADGMPGRGPRIIRWEANAIYLGNIISRDPQTGRPAVIAFKILANEVPPE